MKRKIITVILALAVCLLILPAGAMAAESESPVSQSYTVTFHSQGGSAVKSQTVPRDQTAKEPTPPTRSHYLFHGWYTDEDCTQLYDFQDGVTQDLDLYAGWVEERGLVILDPDFSAESTPNTADASTDSPKTGDKNTAVLWALLLGPASLTLIGTVAFLLHKKQSQKS